MHIASTQFVLLCCVFAHPHINAISPACCEFASNRKRWIMMNTNNSFVVTVHPDLIIALLISKDVSDSSDILLRDIK